MQNGELWRWALIGLAGLLAFWSFAGVVRPFAVANWLNSLSSTVRFGFAVGGRLVLGAVLCLAATSTRTPRATLWLGVVAFAAGLVALLAGPERVDRLVAWWVERPASWLLIGYSAAALLACFLLYSAWY